MIFLTVLFTALLLNDNVIKTFADEGGNKDIILRLDSVLHEISKVAREQGELRSLMEHKMYRLERQVSDLKHVSDRKLLDLQTYVLSMQDQMNSLEQYVHQSTRRDSSPSLSSPPARGRYDNTVEEDSNYNHINTFLQYTNNNPRYDDYNDDRTTPAPTEWPSWLATPLPNNHPYDSRSEYDDRGENMNDNSPQFEERRQENYLTGSVPEAPGDKQKGALKRSHRGVKRKSALKQQLLDKWKLYHQHKVENEYNVDDKQVNTYQPLQNQEVNGIEEELNRRKNKNNYWDSYSDAGSQKRMTGWYYGVGSSIPKQPKLADNCPGYVDAITSSEPLIFRNTSTIGAIMKDVGNHSEQRVWTVEDYNTLQWSTFYEYTNEADLLNRKSRMTHQLPRLCSGYGPVIHKGHLYCYLHTTDRKHIHLMDYSLTEKKKSNERRLKSSKLDIDMVVYDGWAAAYLPIQLSADENGLWLIAPNKAEFLTIYKLDFDTLKIVETYVTDVLKVDVGPGYVVCGVWYALNSHDSSFVSYMYNTHTSTGYKLKPDVLPSPQADIVSLQYNPVDQHVYAWLRVIHYKKSGKGSIASGTAEKYSLTWREE